MDELDGLVPKLGSMNKVELTQMLTSLQNLLHKTKELLDKETEDLTDSSLYKYDPNPSIDSKLLDDVFEYKCNIIVCDKTQFKTHNKL